MRRTAQVDGAAVGFMSSAVTGVFEAATGEGSMARKLRADEDRLHFVFRIEGERGDSVCYPGV